MGAMTKRITYHAGEPAEYLLIEGHLQEGNWYKERFRSWFVGDAVLEDGSMYLCTPVDPLFLALPLLESSRMQVTLRTGDAVPLSTPQQLPLSLHWRQRQLVGVATDICSALAAAVLNCCME